MPAMLAPIKVDDPEGWCKYWSDKAAIPATMNENPRNISKLASSNLHLSGIWL